MSSFQHAETGGGDFSLEEKTSSQLKQILHKKFNSPVTYIRHYEWQYLAQNLEYN